LHGQKLRTLVNERKAVGAYTVEWDGKDQFGKAAASGVYFYRLEAGAFVQTRKMLFMK
jgi:flagellar hook assembly protein FlgD